MAICMVFSPPRDTYSDEVYEKVLEHLGGAFPPASMSLHLKGKTEQGEIRIVDVFESAEAFEEFAASHVPALEQVGVKLDDVLQHVSIFEIEKRIG
jgi:hypothetical protein